MAVLTDSVRIWEGTTTVLSLDLARAAQDPATLKAFISVRIKTPGHNLNISL